MEESGLDETKRIVSSRYHKLLWFLPVLAGIIFTSGLFYSFSISRENSKDLSQIQDQTYPFLEKVSLLKATLKSIQTGFYYAAAAMDLDELEKIREEKNRFLTLLGQLEASVEDRESLRSLQSLFEEYFQGSEKLSLIYIENKNQITPPQFLIDQVKEKGSLLSEGVQNLEKEGGTKFKAALKESEENSLSILRANLMAAILGMFLMIAFSAWILLLNTRLLKANRDLDHQVKSRTQELESFVYTVSHDLKSPVVSMQGMASMLLQNNSKELSDDARHYAERIIFNANYMEELILGLLTLSRVGRTRNLKMADSKEVLDEVLGLQEAYLKERNIEVVVQPPLPRFLFDHLQLTQIFQNLISNAAKFMGDQPHPKIEIGGTERSGLVEFYIKDNGIGIDPSYHEKVFAIFQRLQDLKVDGTGVGLSIVKKIIDLAGGKIWIESQKGKGATFFLQLPKNM